MRWAAIRWRRAIAASTSPASNSSSTRWPARCRACAAISGCRIAACVIGGVSIAGGIGSVPGALLGALFLGLIVNALPVVNVSPFWQMLISGAVILAAVIVNARSEKQGGRLILREARMVAGKEHGA